jgi:hypothetical protein
VSIMLAILEGFYTLLGWIRGNKDQKIGKEEQLNADLADANKKQDAELQAALDRPDDKQLSDSLHNGRF